MRPRQHPARPGQDFCRRLGALLQRVIRVRHNRQVILHQGVEMKLLQGGHRAKLPDGQIDFAECHELDELVDRAGLDKT